MSNSYFGDDQRPTQPEPDPALVGYPPPAAEAAWYSPIPGYGPPPAYSAALVEPDTQAHPGAWGRPTAPVAELPRPYQQVLRGPRFRWWKPLLSLVVLIPMLLIFMLLAQVPILLYAVATGVPDPIRYVEVATTSVQNIGPAGFAYINLALIVLIPASMLSTWIVHRVRPRFVSSVVGGIRWRWLLRCLMVILPIWLVYVGVSLIAQPSDAARPAQWLPLLVMGILLTPLQAAGEEYFFRGWIMQNVGAWFARPMLGLVVSLTLSSALFAAAHLSPDPWVLGVLASTGLMAGLATWRTGGLEAAIVIHAVNNVLTLGSVILFGGWEEAFVDTETTGTPMMLLVTLLVEGGALALLLWQAKRAGVQSLYQPPTRPQVTAFRSP